MIKTKYGNASLIDGRYRVSKTENGRRTTKLLHRLIFEDYYNIDLDEEFPDGVVIHHEDGNPLNNEIWNLVPMTRAEHNVIHSKGRKASLKTRALMSIQRQKENHPMYGKYHSKESREKMKQNHKDFSEENHPQYRHDINNADLLKEYESTNITRKELAKKYNCSKSCIDSRLRKARSIKEAVG